jgi:aspartate beta-hydroxylase
MTTEVGNSDELIRQAMVARARGDARKELQLIDIALTAKPNSPRALNMRGMRALADADFARAVDCFTRAAAADPGQPALLVNLASAHRGLKDDDGERAAIQAALDIDQLQLTPQLRMAELFERQGRMSDAARHWGAVVQLGQQVDAPTPAVHDALARGNRFLQHHNAQYADTLDRELANAVPSGQRGYRFRVCVDHMLRRRPLYRNECAGVHYPFLPADEFFDRALFPWFAELEAKTPKIRREALALLEAGDEALRPYVRLDKGTPQNKWSPLDGSLDWGACFLWEYGTRNDAVCDRCPETAAALAAAPQNHVPGKAPSAFFSILKPGAKIPPHTGVTNTRAIIHLPLVVPPGCGFRVGGETREWVEGQAFAFDDTIEHEAWNNSDQPRVILILDVWNPHLTVDEQGWLEKLFSVADRDLVSARA